MRNLLFGCVCIGLLALSACEYVWEEDTPQLKRSGNQPHSGRQEAPQPKKPVQPSDVRPTLVPGEEVSGQQKLPDGAKRVDILSLLENKDVVLGSNMPSLGDFGNVIDEFENTLSKSDGTNPYVVTFSFKTPRKLKGVRVLSTYSDYKWAFSIKDGKRFVTDVIIDGQWSTMTFKEPVECSVCQVEVLRVVRDNYVHLNEVELYE